MDIFASSDDKNPSAQIHYADYVKIIIDHHVAHTFIMGGGTVQYGMGRWVINNRRESRKVRRKDSEELKSLIVIIIVIFKLIELYGIKQRPYL